MILHSEFSPVLTDVEVSPWSPVPHKRSGFVLPKKVA